MCYLYPAFSSCFGIRLRIGLLYIAILSIVTGALINAAIKKLGVDVSSIRDVVVTTTTTTTLTTTTAVEESDDTDITDEEVPAPQTLNARVPRVKDAWRRMKTTRPELPVESIGEDGLLKVISFEDSGGTDNDPPPKSEGSNASGGTDDDPPPKPEGSNESGGTDDDPPPKPEGSNESGGTDNDPPPKPEGSKEDGDAKSSKESDVSEGSKKPGDPKGSKEPGDPKGSKESEDPDGSKDSDDANPTETTRVTTTTPPGPSTTKEELFTEVMGKVNRNGLSFLSITFIFLGIILLIANFVNSPELALIYVWLLVSTIIASLVILAATVGECTLAPHSCLLSKLDDFTGTMICLFWLLYISAWTHFAAVANGMARQVQPL